MEVVAINLDFSICKIKNISDADFTRGFVFLSKTDEEISLVCESAYAPVDAIIKEAGWKAFRIAGTLDFSMVGVIASISRVLSEAGISVFVVSTYNTDYVFMKSGDFDRAMELLESKL